MLKTERMSVAEVKRHFSDVMAKVVYGDTRVVVERRGRPMVVISPANERAEPVGPKVAEIFDKAGPEGDAFAEFMDQVVAQRRQRPTRPVDLEGLQDPPGSEPQ